MLTANIHEGKIQEAFSLAVKAAKFLNEKFGTNAQVHRNVSGPVYQVHWVTTYESHAALEKSRKQM